jgi:uncharacterized protein (DUF1330 family)
MPAYAVADVEWHDEAQHAKEAENFFQFLKKYGGEFLVASKDVKVFEGRWKPRTLIIIKFPNMKALRAWYDSKEYAPLLAIRRKYADSNAVAVETKE